MTESLEDWDQRLGARFEDLRNERDRVRPGSPIFALEHGLSVDEELPALQATVRQAVLRPRLPRSAGLPFVVYAAEVGYGYRGDEFWPGFEEATPGWTSHGVDTSRRFIRHRFEEFAETYGGARLSGRWAQWFKNIAWPITHAVLAKDLQRHLARLLYDYRSALTAELLEDHGALGERLAQRSYDTSARFRNFAENTELLGLVAAALLIGDEDDTHLLTPEVLRRLVSDLNKERQAGAWLLDAKRAAVHVRRKGWMRGEATRDASRTSHDGAALQTIEAALTLRRTPAGWKGYVFIPSYDPLARRVPSMRELLQRSRYRIDGVDGVQSRGALLYDRGPVPLERWPTTEGQSLVRLEAPSPDAATPGMLADQCRMPPGPWLFRMTEPGVAVHVRTRMVRQEVDYILVGLQRHEIGGGDCREVELATADATAVTFRIPSVLSQAVEAGLMSAGLSVAPEVSVTPVGLVPAAWDGEGLAEWPAGESPLLAIRSSRAVARCIASTETEAKDIAWPTDSETLLVQLVEPATGTHLLSIELLDDVGEVVTQGRLAVRLREPVDSASTTTARQGMQARAFPPYPTLTDLWTGKSRLDVTGPDDERAKFEVRLTSLGGGRALGGAAFSSQLPIGEERWWELFRGVQRERRLDELIDQAEEVVINIEHPALGTSEVRARRPFEPLRWATGQDRSGPWARLVNHSADQPALQFYPAEQPAKSSEIRYEDDQEFRFDQAGLVLARCGDLEAATIVLPHVSGGLDALGLLNVRPTLQTCPRTVESVRQCLVLARMWGCLAETTDATGSLVQLRVLEAICAYLGGLVGGPNWWKAERHFLDGFGPTSAVVRAGIGRGADERSVAEGLLQRRRSGSDIDRLTDFYRDAMAVQCRWLDRDAAQIVADMARTPEVLDSREELVVTAIRVVLDRPAIFRLARLLAMSETIDFTSDEDRTR